MAKKTVSTQAASAAIVTVSAAPATDQAAAPAVEIAASAAVETPASAPAVATVDFFQKLEDAFYKLREKLTRYGYNCEDATAEFLNGFALSNPEERKAAVQKVLNRGYELELPELELDFDEVREEAQGLLGEVKQNNVKFEPGFWKKIQDLRTEAEEEFMDSEDESLAIHLRSAARRKAVWLMSQLVKQFDEAIQVKFDEKKAEDARIAKEAADAEWAARLEQTKKRLAEQGDRLNGRRGRR